MQITVEFDENNQVIRGKISGNVDRAILRQYVQESKNLIKQKKTSLVLSDYREAIFPFSVLEVFTLPEQHSKMMNSLGLNIHGIKRALLFKRNASELASFFEDVAVNRGQKVKVFYDESEAIQWLINK